MKINASPLILLIAILGIFPGCRKAATEDTAAPHLDPDPLQIRFYYDLGPATVDVAAYPKQIQDDYKVFLAVCTACHTSARPLNAPMISREDWKRFVHRMHIKMQRRGLELGRKESGQVIDFLVHDSKVRKVEGKAAFYQKQAELKLLFEEVSKERERLILEEARRVAKREFPYVGVK